LKASPAPTLAGHWATSSGSSGNRDHETRCTNPRRDGVDRGRRQGLRRSRLRRERHGQAVRRSVRDQSQGRRSREDRIRRRGVRSLEGKKTQGRHGRHADFGSRAATDFRGDQSPGGERGAPARDRGRRRSSQRQAGKPDREVDGYAAEGEPFEEFNPRSAACLKHDGGGFGRNKASGGSKP
jgi:hypothetical protein